MEWGKGSRHPLWAARCALAAVPEPSLAGQDRIPNSGAPAWGPFQLSPAAGSLCVLD